jgi:excisionase family DNA binding protein
MDPGTAPSRMPRKSARAEERATVEAARRSLDIALGALREVQASQHQVERLVRQALESVCRLTESTPAPDTAVHESPFLSVVEVAEVLGVTRKQARQMVKDGTLPSVRLGQRVVVPRASLADWQEAIDAQGLG